MNALVPRKEPEILGGGEGSPFPAIVADAGDRAHRRFAEFFTANIRNRNTRAAYYQAVQRFLAWCEGRGLGLAEIEPVAVAAYIEQHPGSPATVKQHLAAIRMLMDWLVVGQVLPFNPATSVRGPKHVVRQGKTPVLTAAEARQLLDSIEGEGVKGLRDRAMIGVMLYSLARIGAVVALNVQDYYHIGRRGHLRFREKGGKHHEMPVHHTAEAYLDAYLEAAGIAEDKKGPLFRTFSGRGRGLSDRRILQRDALAMVKRRAEAAGLSDRISNHSFRATGITVYLEEGGQLEHAQHMAGHASARTTKLYDRREQRVTLDEVERIRI